MNKKNINRFIFLGLIIHFLLACSFAPQYKRPPMPVPVHYKENKDWKPGAGLAALNKVGAWWLVFDDPVLNELENKLTFGNQDLKAVFARLQEARAAVQMARSAFVPTIRGIGNANTQQTSKHVANPNNIRRFSDLLVGTDLTYELDVWGRVRNSVASTERVAEASASDLAAATLSIRAELASDYFSLRGAEAAQRVLDDTVIAYQKALFLTRKRYTGGASPISDVDQAEEQLENAKTLASDTRLQQAQLQHAIAVLVGDIPANFNMPPEVTRMKLVSVDPELPSTLLERRPDVAAAEQRVQAANLEIGVARAAFFPQFTLSSIAGFESRSLANLFTKPSIFWSLGPPSGIFANPLATVILYDGGYLEGLLKSATASYHETVALYRQTVLTAFQEVEDGLAAVRWLDREEHSQIAAAAAASRSLTQAKNRYVGGITNYLDVVVNENIALQAELALVNIRTRRQLASVQLIKALGGGWACSTQCAVSCPIRKGCSATA
ncbi:MULTISPECIES: efflux transporter outer membrane subunit [Legionella]|uniref:Outer membrane efflux protein n=1 Tax=Legionella drozanskii LLAP-1 TaxID=1212489 RepID=A0A0W0SX42_9GAMM|nr:MULTISPECIES: efflux transporter outer membrane subunit [Legionella]KTC87935.1 outer membrane efflux protein [Legionella drozanskii LLAP-1]